ncbi:MAG: SpoIIE family protein phosphatase [Actinobacteria bacterium]|nr:SpoIIE family protein phosphatase [Actinomycetota bacterium]
MWVIRISQTNYVSKPLVVTGTHKDNDSVQLGDSLSGRISRRASSTTQSFGGRTVCRGPYLLALRVAWIAVAVFALVPAVAGFWALWGESSLDALFQSGVFSVDSELPERLTEIGIGTDALLLVDLLFRLLSFGIFALTGIVIFARKSDDWMTGLSSVLLLSAGMTWFAPLNLLGENSVLFEISQYVGHSNPFSPETARTVLGMSLLLFLLLFPDGHFVPRWARYLAVAAAVHVVLWIMLPGSVIDPATWPEALSMWVVVMGAGFGIAAQIYRYFAVASPIHKQQTKLVVSALGAMAFAVVFLFAFNPGLGSGFENLTLVTPRVEAIYNLVLLVLLALAVLLLPISIGISVLRYRLWDLDVLINKTLVYGALTGILALGYGAIVVTIGTFVTRSYLTVAVATLLVSLAAQPLRRRIQDLIDRRFYRARYDAARTVDDFTARLRQEIDLETLSNELLTVVSQTVAPTGVSVWVPRNTRGVLNADAETMYRIAFSVAGGSERIRGIDFDEIELDSVAMDTLRRAPGPLDLDRDDLASASLESFRDVYVRLAVPLVSQGELVGVLNLGPRLSDTDYSTQDYRLLEKLSSHAAAAVRVALLVREHDHDLRERERMESEMRVAQMIQQQLLPRSLPQVEGWDVEVHYHPAREVGGDFYDFMNLPDGRIAIVAGDVTGKGVPAALVMATTRSLLRGEIARKLSPAEVLRCANDQLCNDIPQNMFVTCMFAIIDPSTGKTVMANAGHNVPYICNGLRLREFRATGMPLGLMAGVHYEESETNLRPGDSFVLHSDGVAEARNEDGEMFGFPRMKMVLEQNQDHESAISSLLAELRTFAGPQWEQEDDITLVVLRRLAEKQSFRALVQPKVANPRTSETTRGV